MTKKTEKKEKFEINSQSPNHEIRSFFIDTTIEAIQYMSNKAYHGRIRNEDFEKIKVQQLKVIINACNVGNRVLKDRQLDDFEKEMNALKHGLLIDVKSENKIVEVSSEALKEIEALDEKLEKLGEGDD